MATARDIFPEAEAALYTVTFTYINNALSVTIPAVKMAATDQIIFGNSPSSSAAIQLVFAANPPGVSNPPGSPLFNNVTLSPGQNTGNLTPLNANGSVNYTVLVGGAVVGDVYAVQVGNGPLFVTVNGTTCTPQTIVVPLQGSVEYYSTDGLTHDITWNTTNGNPFPGLSKVYPLPNPQTKVYTTASPVNPYGYTMGPGTTATGGGGTVRVRGTN
jgi:hypothetical protein